MIYPLFNENISLKEYCTFGIGGPARYFVVVDTLAKMQETVRFCYENKFKLMVIGKGSNCLFDDKGFNGVVILNKITFCKEIQEGTFHVGAGYSFALLGTQTARKGFEGLEFASGIPASVGGAIYMNAGANKKETSLVLSSVDYVDEKGDLMTLNKSDLTFSYRYSSFQKMKGAIVGATFILNKNPEARKKQIEIFNSRKKSQPYGDKSAGCVFLNPECEHAGALIDRCGLKGTFYGNAQVSTLHGNFLINAGGATSDDMKGLVEFVKKSVKEQTSIELECELRYIPYEALE